MFYRAIWATALLVGVLLWAHLWQVAVNGPRARDLPFTVQFGTTLGMAAVPYLTTAILALVMWFFSKKPNAAMWTWTVALLIAMIALSIGGARGLSGH